MEESYQKRTADREALLKEAKSRFKDCEEHWASTRQAYLEDQKFLSGDQWPEKIKQARERDSRPTLIVDKLNQYRRQVVNDGRQNRPQPKVFPVDEGDNEVAEAFVGIIRNIWSRSNADEATDWALDCAVSGGVGYIRILTEYVNDDSFDQDVLIRRVRNPLSVYLDPDAQESDGSDAQFAFVVDEVPVDEFTKKWPKAKKTDWGDEAFDGWYDAGEKTVRVAEYFHKVEEPRTLLLLDDGTTVAQDEYDLALEAGIQPPQVVRKESRPIKKVKWCRMTAAEVLEESDWLGSYIPVVPVFGEERDIGGKQQFVSLIRYGKDAQRLYNFSRSAFAERVALAPKAPWIAAAGQIDEFPEWKDPNSGNYQVLRYIPTDVGGTPVPPPQRIPGADVPAGLMQDMTLAEHDIQAALGMYSASLGERSNEKSGRAIMARQREGDVATFHFPDNLNRAIRHLGRILVDLIPKVYDTKRVVRLLGEDGEAEMAEVDPSAPVPVSKVGEHTVYNLSSGRYDVDVTSGPSYTTKRTEASEAMLELAKVNPSIFPVLGDLLVRNMDWPGADDIAKRLKAMLPPQIQQLEADEEEIPPQAKMMLDQMSQQAQQAIGEREQAIQQLQMQLQEATKALEDAEKKLGVEKAQVSAEYAKMDAMRTEVEAQIQIATQELQNERKLLDARYQELSAKLELAAMKQMVPQVMPQAMPEEEEREEPEDEEDYDEADVVRPQFVEK